MTATTPIRRNDGQILDLIAKLPANAQAAPWIAALARQQQSEVGPKGKPSRIEQMQLAAGERENQRVAEAKEAMKLGAVFGGPEFAKWRTRVSTWAQQNLLLGPPAPTFVASAENHAAGRNRYSNIFSFDHARVLLRGAKHKYINASLLITNQLTGSPHPSSYIAAQGPLKNTVNDFWLMAWEQQSAVIVMLTGCNEGGREKCFQYWPQKGQGAWLLETESITFKVECVSETEKTQGLEVRSFKFIGTEHGGSPVERVITQIHFTTWPDHQSADPSSILLTIDIANEYQKAAANPGPMIVHCSAGVGRTGTFVVIDSVLKRIHHGGFDMSFEGMNTDPNSFENDPIYQCVMTIRSQRVMMVQTLEQFKVCYEAVLFAVVNSIANKQTKGSNIA
ncbi:UNVERIFIED_CONTAM: hypothetical protein HDU68_010768 [Siphonaria sp. JEL0065]|nr:hypothetical protein HDU68_010768 [Siphonaria sp. JEL0065]